MFRFPTDIDARFQEMQRRQDELFRTMFERDPFTETLLQSPFFSMTSARPQTSMLRNAAAPQSPARTSRIATTLSPSRQRQISVSEVDPYSIDETGVSEAEKQDLEEAIRLSLLEEQQKRAPVVQDLDDDDIEEIYARHAQQNSPVTVRSPPPSPGTRSNPISLSNDDYDYSMVIDEPNELAQIPMGDDDEELKAAIEASLEASKLDEIRRQERDLVRQQQEEYEASVREDTEIERKKQWRTNWVTQASQPENLPFEPLENDPNAVKLVIRLPNGTRLNRRFLRTDTINTVKRFVDFEVSSAIKSATAAGSSPSALEAFIPDSAYDVTYDLATDFPNKLFEDVSVTLEQAQLAPRAMISARLRFN